MTSHIHTPVTTDTKQEHSNFLKLTLGVIGVVYGDIGTSPIYAFREALHSISDSTPTTTDILGILSLIIWALMIIVTLKYVFILLHADNEGEGGTLALMSLVQRVVTQRKKIIIFLGILGASLFYGDSIITPALSVLSAVEGLELVSPDFKEFILPMTTVIIFFLFMFQYKGTGKVSLLFGPIVIIWFITLASMGIFHILKEPTILKALSPFYAGQFLIAHGSSSFFTLGAVFLAVTGAEALYADLGHFGKKPIHCAWMWFVLPSLILNYLGQGALVVHSPEALDNPFFKMVPTTFLMPLVILSTLATIIASQAVITGAYSMTQQAVNLGFFPRMSIKQTSDSLLGQIYMPAVNYAMLFGVLFLVFSFRTSSSLATAYGISVTGTMVITAIMLFFVVWKIWHKPLIISLLLVSPLILIDSLFLGSNLLKILEGGWVALAIAGFMMMMMLVWLKGTYILTSRDTKRQQKLENFLKNYQTLYPNLKQPQGTAFFFSADANYIPAALIMNIQHNKVLHEKNVILTVKVDTIPHVSEADKISIEHLDNRFSKLHIKFGFKDIPDVQSALLKLNNGKESLIKFDWSTTSIFLSRKTLRANPNYGLSWWQDLFYIWMHKNANDPTHFYKLPIGRVVEVGRHVPI